MAEGATGIPVVVMGLGEIGQAIARAALEQPDLRLVAVVDPARSGARLSDVLGGPAPEIVVTADRAQAFQLARGGVVLQAGGPSFEAALPDLHGAVRAGLSVVSTCEELAYPWLRYEEQAEALDRLCEANEVAVVGLGVNPGFVLDRLPAFLSHVTGAVHHARALRVEDVAAARPELQRKAGVGLTEEAFHAAAERGEVGYAGLTESAMLAALGCGFDLDEVDEELVPLLADEEQERGGVAAGLVVGLHQTARGYASGAERVRLELVVSSGAEEPRDEVHLDGRPPVRVIVPGGIPADRGTACVVVNAAAAVTQLRGLVTVLDLPTGR